jgi:hypothetical protein
MSLQMKSPAPRCGAETGLQETSSLGRIDGPEISTKSGCAQAEIEARERLLDIKRGSVSQQIQSQKAYPAWSHAETSVRSARRSAQLSQDRLSAYEADNAAVIRLQQVSVGIKGHESRIGCGAILLAPSQTTFCQAVPFQRNTLP